MGWLRLQLPEDGASATSVLPALWEHGEVSSAMNALPTPKVHVPNLQAHAH